MGCNVMTYDFTTIMDRSGKDALAVDAIGAYVSWAVVPTKPKDGFSAIPMWVPAPTPIPAAVASIGTTPLPPAPMVTIK